MFFLVKTAYVIMASGEKRLSANIPCFFTFYDEPFPFFQDLDDLA
jgi:hypothetical protein